MDWHIEFGEMKERLDQIRQEYLDDDGVRLALRPLVVRAPAGIQVPAHRQYEGFRRLVTQLRQDSRKEDRMARSKLKGLRNVLKQGEEETRFYLNMRSLTAKLKDVLGTDDRGAPVLYSREDPRRSLIFDAIELEDHYRIFEEVRTCVSGSV